MFYEKDQLKKIKELIKGVDMLVIPCSSVKAPVPMMAKDFYQGKGYFLHQKRLAEISCKPWSIFSTKYGILSPTETIEPYDLIWSRAVKNDNCSMRGKDIPIATEEQRQALSREVLRLADSGVKILSFCSLHYKKHIHHPGIIYFNEEVAKLLGVQQKGIQFLVRVMSELWSYWDEI